MKYLLVVFLLMDGQWVRGDTIDGWGSLEYASKEICLEKKQNADRLQADLKIKNPRAYDKKFACEPAPVKK